MSTAKCKKRTGFNACDFMSIQHLLCIFFICQACSNTIPLHNFYHLPCNLPQQPNQPNHKVKTCLPALLPHPLTLRKIFHVLVSFPFNFPPQLFLNVITLKRLLIDYFCKYYLFLSLHIVCRRFVLILHHTHSSSALDPLHPNRPPSSYNHLIQPPAHLSVSERVSILFH